MQKRIKKLYKISKASFKKAQNRVNNYFWQNGKWNFLKNGKSAQTISSLFQKTLEKQYKQERNGSFRNEQNIREKNWRKWQQSGADEEVAGELAVKEEGIWELTDLVNWKKII